MSVIQRTRDTYVGLYDFAASGGAIGAFDLGVQIPPNVIIHEFGVRVVTAPLSAGAATISFDLINNTVNPAVTTVGGLIAATGKAQWIINTIVMGQSPTGAGPLAPIFVANSFSVGMSIAAATLTVGKLIFFLRATSFDF